MASGLEARQSVYRVWMSYRRVMLVGSIVIAGLAGACSSTPSDGDVGNGAKTFGFGAVTADDACVGRALKKSGVSDAMLKSMADATHGSDAGRQLSKTDADAIGRALPAIRRC